MHFINMFYLVILSRFITTALHPFFCNTWSFTRFSQLSPISEESFWKS